MPYNLVMTYCPIFNDNYRNVEGDITSNDNYNKCCCECTI